MGGQSFISDVSRLKRAYRDSYVRINNTGAYSSAELLHNVLRGDDGAAQFCNLQTYSPLLWA